MPLDNNDSVKTPIQSETRIDYLTVTLLVARTKLRVLATTAAGLIFGLLLSLIMKPNYRATASILPPQQASSAVSALMGQLGSLSSAASLSTGLNLKSPADMYIGILESNSIAEHVISSCDLRQRYHKKTLVDTRIALERHTTFESGKDGLIHLTVEDHSPEEASKIANSYLAELYRANSELVIGEAAQRKMFYDRRLAEEKQALSESEIALRNTQQKTGVIQLTGQAASIINSIAQTRADLVGRQVALQAAETYATSDNPEVIQLRQEIAALQAHLVELQKAQESQAGGSSLSAGQLPEAALQYQRQARELKYHETLFDLLTRQSEAAKLDEAKSAPVLQIIDRPSVPDKKSGPSALLLSLGFAVFGFLLGVALALIEFYLQRLRGVPEQARKLDQIRAAILS